MQSSGQNYLIRMFNRKTQSHDDCTRVGMELNEKSDEKNLVWRSYAWGFENGANDEVARRFLSQETWVAVCEIYAHGHSFTHV